MEQYNVTGMSCAACSARVEKAVSKVPGVTSCSVSLLTNSMGVEGTASPESIIKAVEEAGYGASPKKVRRRISTSPKRCCRRRTWRTAKLRSSKKRLIASVGFLARPHVHLHGAHDVGLAAAGLSRRQPRRDGPYRSLLLTVIIMVINQQLLHQRLQGAHAHRAPNMDTLVALGSSRCRSCYSTYALFAMTGAQVRGDMDAVMDYMDGVLL